MPEFIVFHKVSKKEDIVNDEQAMSYVQTPACWIEGQIITDPQRAQAIVAQLEEIDQMRMAQEKMQMVQQMEQMNLEDDAVRPETEPRPVSVQEITYGDLIENCAIEVVKVLMCRVHQCVVVGDKLLYKRIMPLEQYPIVPFINIHTRTPYPVGDVRLVKGTQEYINKTRSLIIAHATTSTNTKILVPEGSVDMAEFEQKWAQPGVAIQYDPTDGAPMAVQPSPLPNELYQNEQTAKNDIDHQLGIYEMMAGNAAVAPQTYKATISLDEFGQRKIKSKLADIEAGLTRVAQVAIPLMQELYSTEKVFRVVQHNNSQSEFVLNKKIGDDKTNEIKNINDNTKGKYDVVWDAG